MGGFSTDDRLRWPGCALALSHAPKRGVPFEGVEEGQKGRVNRSEIRVLVRVPYRIYINCSCRGERKM